LVKKLTVAAFLTGLFFTVLLQPSEARPRRAYVDASGNATQIIGGRPSDCPRKYCGCGLRKYLGINDRRLDLAIAWARLFPRRTHPAPGYAAVRPGHVMLLVSPASQDGWYVVRDYNSGRGLSRIHTRFVGRGWIFVDPSVRHAGL
jgi:hypothetical protein